MDYRQRILDYQWNEKKSWWKHIWGINILYYWNVSCSVTFSYSPLEIMTKEKPTQTQESFCCPSHYRLHLLNGSITQWLPSSGFLCFTHSNTTVIADKNKSIFCTTHLIRDVFKRMNCAFKPHSCAIWGGTKHQQTAKRRRLISAAGKISAAITSQSFGCIAAHLHRYVHILVSVSWAL